MSNDPTNRRARANAFGDISKPMRTLIAFLLGIAFSVCSAGAQTGEDYVQKQLAAAKGGDYWAKYNLWDTYHRGKHGVPKDEAKAKEWLPELTKGVSVVKFEPANGFHPTNPGEFLSKFNEHSNLRSGRNSLGGASFFRTTKQGDKLLASFLTCTPDQMKSDIAKNPDLKFVSAEKLSPEGFVKYEQSKQESLD